MYRWLILIAAGVILYKLFMTSPGSGSLGARSKTTCPAPPSSGLPAATIKSSFKLALPVKNRSIVLELMTSFTE